MLLRNMQVLQTMKTHVVKTTADATLAQAADLMDLYQTAGLPVVDSDGRLSGLLSECDIMRAARQGAGRLACEERVGDWMTTPAVSVNENLDLAEAGRMMVRRGLKRAPVVTDAGEVIGMLNRIDLLQAVFEGAIPDVFADEP